MKCPRDKSELRTQTYEADIQVDTCPGCGGMWLDKGELEAIQTTLERNYAKELSEIPNLIENAFEMARQTTSRDLVCPHCDKPMENRQYGYCSQVMIDGCPHCGGVWLDEAETMALELFFERSRLEAGEIRRGFWGSLADLYPKQRGC